MMLPAFPKNKVILIAAYQRYAGENCTQTIICRTLVRSATSKAIPACVQVINAVKVMKWAAFRRSLSLQ